MGVTTLDNRAGNTAPDQFLAPFPRVSSTTELDTAVLETDTSDSPSPLGFPQLRMQSLADHWVGFSDGARRGEQDRSEERKRVGSFRKSQIPLVLQLPKTGDSLSWTGPSIYNADTIARVAISEEPGILHPRRKFPDALKMRLASDQSLGSLLLEVALVKPSWQRIPVFRAQVEGIKAVVKIFMRDVRVPGQNVDLSSFDFLAHPELLNEVETEARAYSQLESLQGSILPYSYGFHKLRLPNGITCFGHVLEYIDGMSPAAYGQTLRETIDEDKAEALLYCTVLEIRKRGVFHNDYASRNIRLLWPLDPKGLRIVIFDFGHATGLNLRNVEGEGMSPTLKRQEVSRDSELFNIMVDEQLGTAVSKSGWSDTPEGRELRKAWYTHPADLRMLQSSSCSSESGPAQEAYVPVQPVVMVTPPSILRTRSSETSPVSARKHVKWDPLL